MTYSGFVTAHHFGSHTAAVVTGTWTAAIAVTANLSNLSRKVVDNRLSPSDSYRSARGHAWDYWIRTSARTTGQTALEICWAGTEITLRGSGTLRSPSAITTISTGGLGAAVHLVSARCGVM